jgi:hypothetical protein
MSGERNLTAESLADQAGLGDVKPVGMVDLSAVTAGAGTAAGALTNIMQFEPMIAGMVSMFFPPAAIAQPFIVMAMPFLIRALGDISQSNGGDMLGAFLELAQHLTKGGPNSPTLSPVGSGSNLSPPSSDDPSRQGSG